MPKLRNGNNGDSNPGSLDCESGILPTELPRSTGFPTTTAWPSMIRQEFDWSTLTSAGETPSLVITSARIAFEPVRRLPTQFAMLIGIFISSCCST